VRFCIAACCWARLSLLLEISLSVQPGGHGGGHGGGGGILYTYSERFVPVSSLLLLLEPLCFVSLPVCCVSSLPIL